MAGRIMHVDLDAFFVEVCRRRRPELRDVPLLVVGGRRDSRGVVQSASYDARRFGVRSGMPIAQAVRLCPEATFVQGTFDHYRQASRTVRQVLSRHAPTVVMASLDEGYLDFAGTERLYPVSLLPVAEAVRDDIRRETGLDCSIGIGTSRMVAKLASDFAKPRGLCEVRAGWEHGFLAGLSLAALPGIGPKEAARLKSLGLQEVAQVQCLSEEQLSRLIGPSARLLMRRARGMGSATLRPDRPARSVSRETTLPRDSRDLRQLEGLLIRFVGLVAADLRDQGLVARTVVLKLRHSDFRTVTRRRTLDCPTDLDQELMGALKQLLPPAFQEAVRRRQGIRLIGASATGLEPAAPLDLFEPEARTRLRALTRAVDVVRDRYGFDAVQPARTLKSARRRRS
ncbi:MAG: DNA polymerase IV [Gemmatimonadota bacterium]|nr:DNA polymerase IV [Gemmatimonadota bacterium]MDH5282595.1 DNA polymerase IV [Gemmatimonadota bacterium]